ncbi:hypothetical protein GCM10023199_07930 [Actinomycetospora chibensis]
MRVLADWVSPPSVAQVRLARVGRANARACPRGGTEIVLLEAQDEQQAAASRWADHDLLFPSTVGTPEPRNLNLLKSSLE